MNQPKRFCKKCLLEDIAEEDFLRNMRQYIRGLDEEIKTESRSIKDALAFCKECDSLINGMCRICGCFGRIPGGSGEKSLSGSGKEMVRSRNEASLQSYLL